MSEKYNVAVVGATGNVGREIISILEQRDFPIDNLYVLASTRSKGKKINFRNEDLIVENLSEFDFIISFGGDGTLLNTITHVGSSNTKILGVNIGKLGFLSYDVSDVFEKILDEYYKISSKYSCVTLSVPEFVSKQMPFDMTDMEIKILRSF